MKPKLFAMLYFSRRPLKVELAEKEETGANALLNKISSFTQLVIGASAILYVLGYISWMLYAWNNHLGMLPAIKEQYFIAGVIPLLILAVPIFIFNRLSILQKKLNQFKPGELLKKIIKLSGFVFFVLLLSFLFSKYYPAPVKTFILIGMVTSFIMSTFFNGGHGLILNIVKIYLVIFSIAVFALALTYVFPYIPTELGGPKQTLVQFDISAKELSPETYSLVFSNPYSNDPVKDSVKIETPSTLRSDSLYLLFESSEFVLVKKSPGRINSTNRLIKLRKSLIQGIIHL